MSNSEKPVKNPQSDRDPKPLTHDEMQQDEGLLDQIIAETRQPQDEEQDKPSRRKWGMISALAVTLLAAALLVYVNFGKKATSNLPIIVAPQMLENLGQAHPKKSSPLRTPKLLTLAASAAGLPSPMLSPTSPTMRHLRLPSAALFGGETALATDGQTTGQKGNRTLQTTGRLAAVPTPPPRLLPQRNPAVQPAIASSMLSKDVTLYSQEPARVHFPSEGVRSGSEVGPRLARLGQNLTSQAPQRPTLPVSQPSLQLQTGELASVLKAHKWMRPAVGGSLKAAVAEKQDQHVWQVALLQDPATLLAPLEPAPLPPKLGALAKQLSPLKADGAEMAIAQAYMVTLVNRVVEPVRPLQAELPMRVLAKNLTYRDQSIESEGTKLFSGLVQQAIQTQDRIELISPEDLSKSPQALLKGQVWDRPEAISVGLRLVESKTGRELNTAELQIPRAQLPQNVAFAPPPGESLDPIQRVVGIMQRFFPEGGDFQLGIWPDKGVEAVYTKGEKLLVRVLAELNAYIQVDYFQADGRVVHLVPNLLSRNVVEGGKALVIGEPGSGFEFEVVAPFGEELLTVIATQHPLTSQPKSQLIEPAAAYIDRLSQDLKAQQARGKVAGAHMIIVTRDQ